MKMKHLAHLLLSTTTLLAGCGAASRPEVKIAGALQAFQDSSAAFTEARRKIVRQRQDNLSIMVERAERTRQQAEQKRGMWRVLKDQERIDLFDNVLSEIKGAGDAQERLSRIRAAHEAALHTSGTGLDRKRLASMIRDLYVLGIGETSGKQIEQYFEYLTAVGKQIATQQSGGTR